MRNMAKKDSKVVLQNILQTSLVSIIGIVAPGEIVYVDKETANELLKNGGWEDITKAREEQAKQLNLQATMEEENQALRDKIKALEAQLKNG